jgi:hypothetical protein
MIKPSNHIGLFLLLVLFCPNILALTYTVEITQPELQQQLASIMPVTRNDPLLSVTVSNPLVGFLADSNKISLQATVDTLALSSVRASARLLVVGSIIYQAEQGAFYLRDLEVLKLDSEHIQPQHIETVKRISQTLLNQLLQQQPVYRLKDDNVQEKLAKAVLKNVEVRGEKLLLTLSLF